MDTATGIKWDGEVPVDQLRHLPYEAGLYCLYSGDRPLYVGKSKCIRQRWQRHEVLSRLNKVRGTGPLCIRWCLTEDEPTTTVEQEYITLLQPALNRVSADHETAGPIRDRRSIYVDTALLNQVDALYRNIAYELYPHDVSKSDFWEAALRMVISRRDDIKASLDAYMKEAQG